jgi:VIT1/CCC1 family predicted Fe2+/Mn2+ transporter
MTSDTAGESGAPGDVHGQEPHGGSLTARLNWLRAGVLGANDGIISTAGLVIGVAAATSDAGEIATAGFAGLIAGAVSMALGEYVSVSTQRDTERALIDKERTELEAMPATEHAELVELLRRRGLGEATSVTVADELTEHDALRVHLAVELGIDQAELANPWAATGSSALAFAAGAVVPLIAILASPASVRIAITFVAVIVGLLATGWAQRVPRSLAEASSVGAAGVRRGVGDGGDLRDRLPVRRSHRLTRWGAEGLPARAADGTGSRSARGGLRAIVRAQDDDELARPHFDVDVAQRVHSDVAGAVALPARLQRDRGMPGATGRRDRPRRGPHRAGQKRAAMGDRRERRRGRHDGHPDAPPRPADDASAHRDRSDRRASSRGRRRATWNVIDVGQSRAKATWDNVDGQGGEDDGDGGDGENP